MSSSIPTFLCHMSTVTVRMPKETSILMTKVEGVRLVEVWNDMADDKRRIVLQQAIDILLELWSHRFSKPGALFKRDSGGEGKDAWFIDSLPNHNLHETGSRHNLSTTSFTHAADFW